MILTSFKLPALLIKHKIWIGFSILLILLVVNSAISVLHMRTTQNTVNSVIEQSQPLVLAAHQFKGFIAQAAGALSNYLLTKNDKQRQKYQNDLWQAADALAQMEAMDAVQLSSDLAIKIEELKNELATFQGYEKKMLSLAKNSLENETALAYAADYLNPNFITLLGSLSTMLSSEDEEDVSGERNQWLNLLHETRYNFQKLMSDLRIYLNQPTASTRENLESSFEVVEMLVNKFAQYVDYYNFEQEEGVETVQNILLQYQQHLPVLIEKNESQQRRMDVYLLDTEILPILSNLENQIDELVYDESQVMQQSSQDLLADVSAGLKAQVILTGFGLVFGIVVAFVIIRVVTRPLNQTVQALQDVAQGEGDLTRRLHVKNRDELGQLADAFNQFSDKLQHLMIEVSSSSAELIEESSAMAQVVNNTKSDISTQSDQINQITVAIDSMSSKIKTVAEHTAQAAELAEQTSHHADEGARVVQQSFKSSDDLAHDVDRASTVINELENDVSNISGVLDVIRGIAEQTNLLALNAAIEAARAGEQGRGFAVVADEVRTLASRTQASTQEIQSMIQRLQDGSHQAVDVMDEGKVKAEQGLQQSREAGDSLEKIASVIEGMLSMNREIAVSTDQQEQSASQISQNISAINQLANQTTSSAEKMANNSLKVNQLSQQLQQLISHFKV
jgi:methyl-accepting chemotaxis protein